MTEKRFTVEFDGHRYFLVIDEDNEKCLARLDTRMDALAWLEIYEMLSGENEQLKQRNDRQAKQLGNIYKLIEEKDWRALSDIIDDFKRCDEQLKREWRCYE